MSPAGKDSNPGTQAEPLLTLSKAVTLATPGITIWMMAGTHSYSATVSIQSSSVKSGTANTVDGTEAAPINVWAVAGVRPVLDFAGEPRSSEDEATAGRGIALWAHYWHLKGLEIINAADNGIHIAGSHNVIENCVIHNNHDAGLQITVPSALESDNTLGAHNKIINCDSYDNWDSYSWNLGENADGFAAKLRIGPGNSFTGCRAWRNADDGWDLYGADDPVTITNSWAFNNKPSSSAAMAEGDGNGFKLGGDDVRAAHVASGLFAFDNAKDGFTANSNPATLTCSGCGAWNNAGKATTDVTITSAISRSTSSAKAEAAVRNADGSLPDLP